MTIDLKNSKKKHPNFVCLSVSAASKFVSGEYTCKTGLKAKRETDTFDTFINQAKFLIILVGIWNTDLPYRNQLNFLKQITKIFFYMTVKV